MKITAWRIAKRKHARTAFSGEGARLFGGRWNNPGTSIVYTAESQSLAVLEMLVHIDSSDLLEKYVLFEVGIDDSLIAHVDASQLPRTWRTDPSPARARTIGDDWVETGASAVLSVPSALVPLENNFLLNPQHKDFPRLLIGKPMPYRFDSRLA